MGQSESTAAAGESATGHVQAGAVVNGVHMRAGYHVVQVQPHSPAAHAGLCSYVSKKKAQWARFEPHASRQFDFVLAADGQLLEREDETFRTILAQSGSGGVELTVYNLRDESTRRLRLVPQRNEANNGQQVVGISIRFTDFQSVEEHVWHVLDVYPRSPAVDAGLVARSDYIVGTPDLQFADAEDFFTFVEANMRQPIRLYVYSAATDSVRLVSITPNNQWGGHGCLGCDVGFGYLHRIPKRPSAAAAADAEPALQQQQLHAHSHAHGHAHAHADAPERRLHPLMIPTAAGFQQQPQLATVPPPTRAVVDATGATAPQQQQQQYKPLSFITVSDDELNKPPPGPPPTTPYIAAPPKAAPVIQAPPTRFMPLGVAATPAASHHAHEHGAGCSHSHSHAHDEPAAPAAAAAAQQPLQPQAPAPFQMPPDASGGFSPIPF